MEDQERKLLAWHNILLGEAQTLAYRLSGQTKVTNNFLDDLAYSLEHLAERVRREKSK